MEIQFVPSKTCIINQFQHFCSHLLGGQILPKLMGMPFSLSEQTEFPFFRNPILSNCRINTTGEKEKPLDCFQVTLLAVNIPRGTYQVEQGNSFWLTPSVMLRRISGQGRVTNWEPRSIGISDVQTVILISTDSAQQHLGRFSVVIGCT